jgi:hypothetical protein
MLGRQPCFPVRWPRLRLLEGEAADTASRQRRLPSHRSQFLAVSGTINGVGTIQARGRGSSMSSKGVRWDAMAKVQRDLLPARDRRELEQALATLEGVPPQHWPAAQAVPLHPGQRRYLFLAPQGWRAVISPAEHNGIQVHNILHEEAIRFLRDSDEREGQPG